MLKLKPLFILKEEMNRKKHLSVLGLRENSKGNLPPAQEIQRAWKRMALQNHPDKVPEDQREEAKERFQEITEAYTALMKKEDLLNFRIEDLDDIDEIIMEAWNGEQMEDITELTDLLLKKTQNFLQNTFSDLLISFDFTDDQHFASFLKNNNGATLTEIEEEIEVERSRIEDKKATQYHLKFTFTEAYNQKEKEIEFDGWETSVCWSSEGKVIFHNKGELSGKSRLDLEVITDLDLFDKPENLDTETSFPDLILRQEIPVEQLTIHNALIEIPFLNKKLKITRKTKGKTEIKLYGEALKYVFKGLGMPITEKNRTQRGKLILELLPVFKN